MAARKSVGYGSAKEPARYERDRAENRCGRDNMIDRRRFLATAGAAVAAPFVVRGAYAQNPEFTLKLHHLLGPKAPAQVNMLEPWANRVMEGSQGRIKIDIYPAMSLGGAPPQLVSQVRDGVVDIVWTVNGYTPELFPRTEVFELPGVYVNDTVAANLAMRDMFEEHLAEEYPGVHIVTLHVHAGQGIHMRDAPVRSPADLAGKKMRIPTRTGAWILESLGATPVGMPVPDLPQALSTGAVDGALIPWEIIPPLKIQELTQYQIEGPANERFGTTTFQISMNQGVWESLPDDLKQVIDQNSGEDFAREVGKVWRDSEEVGIGVALKDGNELITLTEEEMQAFRTAMEPVVQRWIDEVTAKGIDGQKLVETARAAIAKHKA
jgi:TRAP-type C4-dicarboxylate transport system substrate-binding protein